MKNFELNKYDKMNLNEKIDSLLTNLNIYLTNLRPNETINLEISQTITNKIIINKRTNG